MKPNTHCETIIFRNCVFQVKYLYLTSENNASFLLPAANPFYGEYKTVAGVQ